MKDRRPINEDDILLTEMLIAKSYGQLKQSVVQASAEALGSVGDAVGNTVRKHPYATAGAAVGAGILLFGLFRLMSRSGSSGRKGPDGGERRSRSDMTSEIFSLLMPVLTPYITAYFEKYLGRMLTRERKNA